MTGIWRGLAKVAESGPLGVGVYHRLSLQAPAVAADAQPGQFVHILAPPPRAGGRGQPPALPLLRRPLSLHDVDEAKGTIDLLFRVKGPGTRALAESLPGDDLDLIGPLGTGFPLGLGPSILVGGGIGVAPLLLLARRLGPAVSILIGFAGRADLDLVEPFRGLPDRGGLVVATEDGTPGTETGKVTEHVEPVLRRQDGGRPVIYACGPRPMLAAVHGLAQKWNVPAWVSLEERLACGVGACRGCAVAVNRPGSGKSAGDVTYQRVCRDGPVFLAGELDWSAFSHDQ